MKTKKFFFLKKWHWAFSIAVHLAVFCFFSFSKSTHLIQSPLGSLTKTDSATLAYIDIQQTPKEKISKKELRPLLKIKTEKAVAAGMATEPKGKLSENEGVSSSPLLAKALGSIEGSSTASPLSRYLFGLRQMIEQNKVYPALSRKMGETGKVLLTLELLKDGTIRNIKLKNTSSFARLNQAALETANKIQKYQPFPDHISEQQLIVEVPIQFLL